MAITPNSAKTDFDVGIIGGGPAGASMAAYLARAGISCVVFESEHFPRPHVGESLVPAANRVLGELGLLEQMEAAGFPHKYGAGWTSTADKDYEVNFEGIPLDCQVDVRFDEREMVGFNQNYTYHVDRGKFDLILLQHANKLGAKVIEGARVRHVDFSENDYPQILYAEGKQPMKARVRLVVDASGRRTLLGHQLKLRVKDPVFNQVALHTWFEGYDRGTSAQQDYIFIHFLPIKNTWVWQIPITDTVTSFGVVTQKERFPSQKEEQERFFWEMIATHPDVYKKLKSASVVRPFQAEGDYSYAMKQFCGDGFVLIGDAARFVDPIFSSGVSVALNSARLASQDILHAFDGGPSKYGSLKNGTIPREAFQTYETTLKRGTKNWYEFISLYYRLNLLFTMFVSDPRYRLDVLKLLQGDVYDEDEPEVLQKMRQIVTAVEQNPKHVWHGLLGDLTATAFEPQMT